MRSSPAVDTDSSAFSPVRAGRIAQFATTHDQRRHHQQEKQNNSSKKKAVIEYGLKHGFLLSTHCFYYHRFDTIKVRSVRQLDVSWEGGAGRKQKRPERNEGRLIGLR